MGPTQVNRGRWQGLLQSQIGQMNSLLTVKCQTVMCLCWFGDRAGWIGVIPQRTHRVETFVLVSGFEKEKRINRDYSKLMSPSSKNGHLFWHVYPPHTNELTCTHMHASTHTQASIFPLFSLSPSLSRTHTHKHQHTHTHTLSHTHTPSFSLFLFLTHTPQHNPHHF